MRQPGRDQGQPPSRPGRHPNTCRSQPCSAACRSSTDANHGCPRCKQRRVRSPASSSATDYLCGPEAITPATSTALSRRPLPDRSSHATASLGRACFVAKALVRAVRREHGCDRAGGKSPALSGAEPRRGGAAAADSSPAARGVTPTRWTTRSNLVRSSQHVDADAAAERDRSRTDPGMLDLARDDLCVGSARNPGPAGDRLRFASDWLLTNRLRRGHRPIRLGSERSRSRAGGQSDGRDALAFSLVIVLSGGSKAAISRALSSDCRAIASPLKVGFP